MDTNKILEAARSNKGQGQEFENKESIKSSLIGFVVAIFLGIILFLIEYYTKNTINFSMIAVGMAMGGTQNFYEGIKIKNIISIVKGVIFSLIAIAATTIFIIQVI